MLQSALKAGYKFVDFPTLAENPCRDRLLAMRHDCDNDLVAAQNLSLIEKSYGVQSTYFLMLRSALYNLLSPPNLAIARGLSANGHAIGLHFDMFGFENLSDSELCAQIDSEINILENEVGAKVEVVSFHQPSNRILGNEIKLNVRNTYSAQDTCGAFYLSDSNMNFRHGDMENWILNNPYDRVQFLTHPEWWTEHEIPISEKWRLMIDNNTSMIRKSLREREAAYEE